VRAVWDAHTAVGTSPARLGGVPGTTDGTMLTALAGVPTVVYGPGGKWIAHQADEFVDVNDIVEHATVYVEAARRFLDSGQPS
jgi:succinyl-diaminopimelate desuccinylase